MINRSWVYFYKVILYTTYLMPNCFVRQVIDLCICVNCQSKGEISVHYGITSIKKQGTFKLSISNYLIF